MNTVVKHTFVRAVFAIGTLGRHSLVRAVVAMDKLVFIILLTMNTLAKHSLLFVLLQKSSVSQCAHNPFTCIRMHNITSTHCALCIRAFGARVRALGQRVIAQHFFLLTYAQHYIDTPVPPAPNAWLVRLQHLFLHTYAQHYIDTPVSPVVQASVQRLPETFDNSRNANSIMKLVERFKGSFCCIYSTVQYQEWRALLVLEWPWLKVL